MHIPELYPRPIKPKYLVIQLKKRKKILHLSKLPR